MWFFVGSYTGESSVRGLVGGLENSIMTVSNFRNHLFINVFLCFKLGFMVFWKGFSGHGAKLGVIIVIS